MEADRSDEINNQARRAMGFWREFCQLRGVDDVYLEGWPHDVRVRFYGLFAGHLSSDKKVAGVSTVMCGLRSTFEAAWADTSGLGASTVMSARRTAALEVKPRRQRQSDSEKNAKEAVTAELIAKIWSREGGRPVEFSAEEMDRYMCALSILVAFHLFLRSGEFAHTRKPREHAAEFDEWAGKYTETTIRANDVVFEVVHHGSQELVLYTAGLQPTPVDEAEVRSVRIVIRLSKTGHKDALSTRFEHIDPSAISDDAGGEVGRAQVRALVRALYYFSDISGARYNDPFFSNHRTIFRGKLKNIRATSFKVLTGKMVTTMLKAHADHPARISAKSLKKGAVRTMQAHTDATGLELAVMAHHKNPASTGHYLDLHSHPVGPLAVQHLPVRRALRDVALDRIAHSQIQAPAGLNDDGSPVKYVRRGEKRAKPSAESGGQ